MIIWIASYPRSGNTFLRIILNNVFNVKTYSIYDDKFDIGSDEQTSDIVGHKFLPDDFSILEAREDEKKYYIKTHDLPDDPDIYKDKVIYLVRDGRESSLSLARYMNNYSDQEISLADVINGNVFGGEWGEHVEAWSGVTDSDFMVIKFEELISSTEKKIKALSEYLEIDAAGGRIPTFDELQKINPKFFKSGKSDSWRQRYSNEENVLFWMKNYKQMKMYGYYSDMPDIFKSEENIYIFRALSDENRYMQKTINKMQRDLSGIAEDMKLIIEPLKDYMSEERRKAGELEIELENKTKQLEAVYDTRRWRYISNILRIFGKG